MYGKKMNPLISKYLNQRTRCLFPKQVMVKVKAVVVEIVIQ